MDAFLQLGDDWVLGQSLDCIPLDDINILEAQDGLPGISIKPETLADTPMEGFLELCSSPTDGSLGADWMEQPDFVFPNDSSILSLPLHLDEDSVFKPSSTAPLTTTTTNLSPSLLGDCKEDLGSLNHVFVDEFLHNLQESSLKLEMETPPSSPSPICDQVAPEVVLDAEADSSPALQVLASGNIEFLQSPLSPDDVESVLSSTSSPTTSPAHVTASSPAPSSPTTVDTSVLYTDNGSWSVSSSDLYKVVENTKSRPTPYSRPPKASKSSKSKGRKQTASISPDPTELELELMSKKDRKKLQNKNAAIRYRMKKKVETDQKRSEVDDLEAVNNSLREKCEELQREVKCMKDLINDIRKARGQPPLALTQQSLLAHSK